MNQRIYHIEHKVWKDEKSNCLITPDRRYKLRTRVNDRLIMAIHYENGPMTDYYIVYWEKEAYVPDWRK